MEAVPGGAAIVMIAGEGAVPGVPSMGEGNGLPICVVELWGLGVGGVDAEEFPVGVEEGFLARVGGRGLGLAAEKTASCEQE